MFKQRECKGIFAIILRIIFTFEIFQTSLAIKNENSIFFLFDRVHGKMLNDTDLKVA